jgi:eukaryotic-like serine/threonine-protein kinase
MHEDLPSLDSAVGPWLILERLDSGSFGVVYRARRAGHPDSPPVVVKVAKRPKDPRFEREAELLRLGIPGAPRFEDEGLWTAPSGERYPYIVMEWVEGLTLYDWFEGSRTSREVLQVLAHVAGALASAHARDAVHRDVKGDNIRVTAEGRAVLVDWGSGWFSGARPLTDTTAPPGTTAYRPPEQRVFSYRFRKDLDARWQAKPTDDLYSLGVAFYRCVTGLYLTPLSEGGEVASSREVVRPSAYATVSLELEALILRLLSNDREGRGTAEAIAREAMAMSEAAGEAVDRPILPTANAEPTDASSQGGPPSDGADDELLSESDTDEPMGPSSSTGSTRPGRRRREKPEEELPVWFTAAIGSGLGAALVAVLVLVLVRPEPSEREPAPWLATPQEVSHFTPDGGVGEEVLSSAQVERRVGPWIPSLGRSMPSKPFPEQRRSPCEPSFETTINGACWVEVAHKRPPCGDKVFDHDGACYLPSFDGPKTPTSGEP